MPSPSHVWADFARLPENGVALSAVRRIVNGIHRGSPIKSPQLFLHGATGTGKSHLAVAAAREVDGTVVMPARDLARRREGVDPANCKLLVIEDVQHLPVAASERLVTLLDDRSSRRLPTILTSISAPADLTHLPRRLTSRLAGGLMVHLPPLSVASRARLLHALSVKNGWRLSRGAIATIAEATPGGVRPMIGAAEMWSAGKHSPAKGPAESQPEEHPFLSVIRMVAAEFETTREEIIGPSRLPTPSTARQVAIRLGAKLLKVRVSEMARILNRSMPSIVQAEAHLIGKLNRDQNLALKVARLEEECRSLVRKLVAQ
jgi:chromosomal replication initiation ATPase DnaA